MADLEIVLRDIDGVLEGPMSLVMAPPVDSHDPPSRVLMSDRAADAFREQASAARAQLAARTPVAYAGSVELQAGEAFVIDDAELSGLRALVLDATELTPIAPAQLDYRIPFCAVGLGRADERIAFVKRTDPHLHHRGGRFFAVARERLERVDEPVFSFVPGFDLVLADDWTVVLNQRAFEMLVQSTGIVERNIDRWIGGITQNLPMADTSAALLRETALTDSRTWRRLKDIQQRGHLKDVTLDDVRAYASSVDLEPDDVVQDGALVFDPQMRFGFLELLNEDLYRGQLTGERFESQRKGRMGEQ